MTRNKNNSRNNNNNQPVNNDDTSQHVNNQPMASMQVIYYVIYFVGISCQSALVVVPILCQFRGAHVGWLLSGATNYEKQSWQLFLFQSTRGSCSSVNCNRARQQNSNAVLLPQSTANNQQHLQPTPTTSTANDKQMPTNFTNKMVNTIERKTMQ